MPTRPMTVNFLPTALTVIGIVLLLLFLDGLAVPILVFILGVILSIVLYPVLRFFRDRLRLPHGVAVTVTLFVALLLGLAAIAVPPIVNQAMNLQRLAEQYADDPQNLRLLQVYPFLERILTLQGVQNAIEDVAGGSARLADTLTTYATRALSNLTYAFFAVLVIVFTLSGARDLVRSAIAAAPDRWRDATTRALGRIRQGMAVWGLVNLGIALATGVLAGIGYSLIGLENAALYGALSFLGELIPHVGPVMAGAVVVVATLVTAPAFVLPALGVAVAVQILLSFVAPLAYSKSIKLHAVTIVLGVLLLGHAFGLLGALLAVPILATVKIVYEEFYLAGRAEVDEHRVTTVLNGADGDRHDAER